ncbi:enoyl-CoA hydratase-related protein [Cupriavidus oxalaticus]|uniref:Enoyl-CoA hydratase echA8 n=1 Tax=Cupriavidus oxalaticus TaxID=96344 RepID=A0A375GMY0_9BURK|nr:enoyl-CoA hydratase-related protein [Cupriavidus oxalaticus]QRQ85240.1 enoyl-CoA hydratase/isomerase family protein [Cupriavidus oxalaticus]QRQ90672.1 enoyl-CoA hydratase/isomerase family protein [Cupriavidus oxalaticus]WQD85198.1 enoyl-CoA hydratase-related protein [Cupriavidus oxalaticus]SPC10091.1 putative enoyl-CoA hydratase echA8 [Cupriavidus oxalaticus]SPC23545.1 putative enoyl-CoA hydratase echA8 [Cupriavidus oxalaticus]
MTISLRFDGELAVLTLDRPVALNALNVDMLKTLSGHVDDIEQYRARGVVVVGGGDRAFCAGADIAELQHRTPQQHLDGSVFGQVAFSKLAALSMPSVAVIRGLALGGGLELAMACSYRVVLAGAKLGLPEIKLGLIPGYGGTQRLPRLVGTTRALDLITTGRMIAADEALEIGLVDRLVEGGDPVAVGKAHLVLVSEGRPSAVHLAREAVLAAARLDLDAGLRAEAELFARATRTDDAREGIEAFLAKRAPQFTGK